MGALLENLLYYTFILNFDTHSNNIVYLNQGLLSPDRNQINPTDKFPQYKKHQVQMKQNLDRLFKFKDSMLKEAEEIKYSSYVININQGIIVYLQKFATHQYFSLINLLISHLSDLAREKADLSTVEHLWNFLQELAFTGFTDLTDDLADKQEEDY